MLPAISCSARSAAFWIASVMSCWTSSFIWSSWSTAWISVSRSTRTLWNSCSSAVISSSRVRWSSSGSRGGLIALAGRRAAVATAATAGSPTLAAVWAHGGC